MISGTNRQLLTLTVQCDRSNMWIPDVSVSDLNTRLQSVTTIGLTITFSKI